MQINNKNYQQKLARVIVLINKSTSSINPTTSTSSFILDPIFPAHEACSADSAKTIFGRRFGIPCEISDKKLFIQIGTYEKMLRIYSISIGNDNYVINDQSDMLDDLLPSSMPWTFRYDTMEDENWSNNMFDYFTLDYSTQYDTAQCYFNFKSS